MGQDKVTLQELVAISSEKAGLTKQIVDRFYRELFAIVEEVLLAGDTLKINGLGTFKTQNVEQRRSININTGEEMIIDGYTKVVFIPDKSLKEFVNQPFAHLSPVELEEDSEQVETYDNKESPENLESGNPKEESIIEPLKVLEEQAIEIKNILAEINGISEQETNEENLQPTQKEETQEQQPQVVQEKYSPFSNTQTTDLPKNKEVTEDPNSYYYRGKSSKSKKRKRRSLSKILVPLFVILFLVIVFFFVPQVNTKINNIFGGITKTTIHADTIRAQDLLMINQIDSLKNDSIAKKKDSVAVALPKHDTVSTAKPQPKAEPKIVQQTPDYKNIKATETVISGVTLATLARKYYGHPDFWVYIFQANKTIIKNPASLEIGSKINIPQLDNSLIDLQNPQTLEKARQMANEIKK